MENNLFDKNKRRIIIDALATDPTYSVNSRILKSILEKWGHNISLDDVHVQLEWLASWGYITKEWVEAYTQVARLTNRGLDVAEGRADADGIDRKIPN